ncbi:MAG: Transcriptional regulator, AraC family [Thermoleophilia bacterium]|nr:Transcriptional regulator, AraC family [Thermoleophilia bacterium]
MIEKVTVPGAIELDQLAGAEPPAQVVWITPDDDVADPPREAHRHDYHELFLVRAGVTEHLVDGVPISIGAGRAFMIGRGQVHQLVGARDVEAVVVRFAEELLSGASQEMSPGWMLVDCGGTELDPPRRELDHAVALVRLLDDELERPPDSGTSTMLGASLGALLTLVRRWQVGASMGTPASVTDPDVALLHRFVRLLEAEYGRHHDAAWYASQIGISTNHLAATLTRLTGRSTKRLVTDRLMTEASRLLRYTDLSVQQVAHRLGYDDPLYLSRAFKAWAGESPTAWREHAHTAID